MVPRAAPPDPERVQETKNDGYRLMVRRDGAAMRLFAVAAMIAPLDRPLSDNRRGRRQAAGKVLYPDVATARRPTEHA
jgi:hypothetical protein